MASLLFIIRHTVYYLQLTVMSFNKITAPGGRAACPARGASALSGEALDRPVVERRAAAPLDFLRFPRYAVVRHSGAAGITFLFPAGTARKK
jgi:hypothetical protein